MSPASECSPEIGQQQQSACTTGLHSQTVPIGVYFANVNVGYTITQPNRTP
ncbi:MAG: hypothetical protein R2788_21240 [Saprospiraceae bacterium]